MLIAAATEQVPSEHRRALAFLQRLAESSDDREDLYQVTEPVLVEVSAVLRTARAGRQSMERIATFLLALLSSGRVRVDNEAVWTRALEISAQTGIDLPDAHMVALAEAEGGASVVSFDRDFDAFQVMKRIEP